MSNSNLCPMCNKDRTSEQMRSDGICHNCKFNATGDIFMLIFLLLFLITIPFLGGCGAQGAQGPAGVAGASVTVTSSPIPVGTNSPCPGDGGWVLFITSGSGTTQSVVCNGATTTVTAQNGITIQQFLFPCGITSSNYKEVLLQLSNGSVMASFSASVSGDMTRLDLLPDGSNFVDTDDSSCQFSISTNMSTLKRSISWQGKVQATWTVSSTFNPAYGE